MGAKQERKKGRERERERLNQRYLLKRLKAKNLLYTHLQQLSGRVSLLHIYLKTFVQEIEKDVGIFACVDFGFALRSNLINRFNLLQIQVRRLSYDKEIRLKKNQLKIVGESLHAPSTISIAKMPVDQMSTFES